MAPKLSTTLVELLAHRAVKAGFSLRTFGGSLRFGFGNFTTSWSNWKLWWHVCYQTSKDWHKKRKRVKIAAPKLSSWKSWIFFEQSINWNFCFRLSPLKSFLWMPCAYDTWNSRPWPWNGSWAAVVAQWSSACLLIKISRVPIPLFFLLFL